MKLYLSSLGIATVAMSLTGCGTLCNFAGSVIPLDDRTDKRPEIYGGVQLDLAFFGQVHFSQPQQGTDAAGYLFFIGCMLADVPLSMVGDTLTLPITLWVDRRRHVSESDSGQVTVMPADNNQSNRPWSTALRNAGDSASKDADR